MKKNTKMSSYNLTLAFAITIVIILNKLEKEMLKYQKNVKGNLRAFKKEFKKYLMKVERLDLQLKQKEINTYWFNLRFTKPNVEDCYKNLIELYPTKKIYK